MPFSELPRPLLGAISAPNLASWLCSSVLLRLSSFPTSSRNCKSCSTVIEPRFVLAIGYLSRQRNDHNDCATTTETRQTEQCQTSSHAGSGKGSYAGIYLNLAVPGRNPRFPLQGGEKHSRRWSGVMGSRAGLSLPTLLPRPLHGIIPTWDKTLTASGIPMSRARFLPAANPASSADARRHVLPKDLPNAVKHLNDEELGRLLAVTVAEAKRRGRQSSPTDQPSPNRNADAPGSLTRGQLNAVRAAFKAGITPARIARQFGLSQSAVRMALKSHKGE